MSDDTVHVNGCSVATCLSQEEEIAKLQGRLRDQSSLINLLRERADRETSNLDAAQAIILANQELLQESRALQSQLQSERKRADSFSRRFDELSENFQEIVQIKDSYKEQIQGLEVTLRQKLDRHHAAIRPIIDAKDDQITKLKDQIALLERRNSELIAKTTVEAYERDTKSTDQQSALTAANKQLERHFLELAEERKFRTTLEQNIQHLRADLRKLQTEVEKRDYKATALHDLIADRGQKLAEKDRKIAQLTSDVQEWRQRLSDSTEKFHAKTAETDVNSRVASLTDDVSRLTRKLQQAEQQQLAVKRASATALANERERSSILRSATSICDLIQLQNKAQCA